MLEQMDSAIGRILAALQRNGLSEKTIVVFTSDNGGLSTAEGSPTSNLPLRGAKAALRGRHPSGMDYSRAGVTKEGSTCKTPVISTDFYPTLLELAACRLIHRNIKMERVLCRYSRVVS
jgi:arylsulfatase A-like enzyme